MFLTLVSNGYCHIVQSIWCLWALTHGGVTQACGHMSDDEEAVAEAEDSQDTVIEIRERKGLPEVRSSRVRLGIVRTAQMKTGTMATAKGR